MPMDDWNPRDFFVELDCDLDGDVVVRAGYETRDASCYDVDPDHAVSAETLFDYLFSDCSWQAQYELERRLEVKEGDEGYYVLDYCELKEGEDGDWRLVQTRWDEVYPDEDEELEVVRRTTVEEQAAVSPLLDGAAILQMQRLVRRVPAAEHVLRFALRVVRLSRPGHPRAPAIVREFVTWGAGPRAAQSLVLGAKARAALQGRLHPTVDDVRAVALPVLRHRIIVNFNAEAEGVRPERIVGELLELASSAEGKAADDSVLRRP